MQSTLSGLTATQLRRAAALKERIDSLTKELNKLLGGGASAAKTGPVKRRGRRKMSAEAREKIAAAQRARWARQKGKK